MKIEYNKLIFFISLLFFIISNSITLSQSKINKGFKFGLELKNYLTEDTGDFNNSFGFTFGGFTAINLHSFPNGAILLKTELNFVNYQYHNPRNRYYNIDTFDVNWNGLPYTVIDEKYNFNVIEIAIMPSYCLYVNEKVSFDFFVGPSIGLGGKDYEIKRIDQNSLNYYTHDDYTSGFVLPISITSGFSLVYKPLIIDVRYKYTNLVTDSRKNYLTNIYLQLGVIF